MLPTRFVSGQSSALRKSRQEGKASMLPKPRRPGSTDRLSTEARRPSTAGHRSSSAEPPRGTFGASRLSREASATKLPLSGRSRSQQGERFGQSSMTPLRSSHYSRSTTTPVRTPSEDRANRSWQTSLDRALAFVTIKDQRPLSNAGWQRAEMARVQEALSGRGGAGAGAGGAGVALLRPLTITRFVEVVGALLAALTRDAKLNNDNYVTKLPHLSKRLLYPGTVSKSWLKTVNTLHAFPHALALIAYLLDLVNHVEIPVSDDWLYVGKDELACLRRDYLYKCWIRFQDPGHQFEDLNVEYLENLKALLGIDEEKIIELQQIIKKYESCLEEPAEAQARAAATARAQRHATLQARLRTLRDAREAARHDARALRDRQAQAERLSRTLDRDIERATAESQQLKKEVEEQPLTVEERARLLDEVDYSLRVLDSKHALAHQVEKMLHGKETELALWQKKTLDSCVEYKQGLIHLTAPFPDLASLAIDEKELMGAECAAYVSNAVEALRAQAGRLAGLRAEQARSKTALARRRGAMLEETRAKLSELKSCVEREQSALEAEAAREAADAAAAGAGQRDLRGRAAALAEHQHEYINLDTELQFWEKQDQAWQEKLSSMRSCLADQRALTRRTLLAARDRRVKLLTDAVRAWNLKLQH